jgi:phosphate transport system permease protein
MSDTLLTKEVRPQKPWLPSKRKRAETYALLLLAIFITVSIVSMTPMKGKLAYVGVFIILFPTMDYIYSFATKGKSAASDAVVRAFVTFAIAIALLPIISILWSVIVRGYKGLHWSLFTTDMHSTSVTDPVLSNGGILHAIIGSILLVVTALIISVPIAILTALYLTEIKGRFARPVRFLVQSMSGVPSIVAGLFVLAAVLYPLWHKFTSFEGSLALSILMIPTIARISEEVLVLVPNDLRESGVALGGTQWRTVKQIVLPAARSGLITAIILGVARVAGETAPIILLAGGGDSTNFNIFSGPMGSFPAYIFKGYTAGTSESIQRAWTGILVLLLGIFFLFALARYLGGRRSSK